MLSLRRETDYSIHLLKKLAREKNSHISLQKVAKDTGISFLFLQKIARKLRLSGLIRAKQGVEGGYELAVAPAKITLNKIIESMEQGCSILPCIMTDKCCKGGAACQTSKKMGKVNKKLIKILAATKLADL